LGGAAEFGDRAANLSREERVEQATDLMERFSKVLGLDDEESDIEECDGGDSEEAA
jgi:hypothetical protein